MPASRLVFSSLSPYVILVLWLPTAAALLCKKLIPATRYYVQLSLPLRLGAEPRTLLHGKKRQLIDNATNRDIGFMRSALAEARKAAECRDEVPIGALVVTTDNNDRTTVLARASNRVETNQDASAHAEMLAMRKAARRLNNWRLNNTTLYTTVEPCPMCLAAAQAFRVNRIVYGAPDMRLGAVMTHIQLLETPHPFHEIQDVTGGVCEDESSQLLKSFFRERRTRAKMRPAGFRGWVSRRLLKRWRCK